VAKKFKPETPLAEAVYKGDRKGVIALLAPLSLAERQRHRSELSKLDKHMEKARFAYGDRTFAGWGKRPTDAQYRAQAAGVFLCGTAKDVAGSWIGVDDLIELARKFPPTWLAELGEVMTDGPAARGNIRDVQRLISEGLVRRPQSEGYIRGLMQLFAGGWAKDISIDAHFKADPGLQHVLLRILEVEGTQDVSLAALDKYGGTVAQQLAKLSERGVYSRAVLIDKALGGLERGWNQFRSGWFSSFHVVLAPTMKEMKPHTRRYLALLGSRTPPTVSFALDCVRQLDAAGELETRELLDGLRPVFMSAVKSHVEAGMAILAGMVKRSESIAPQAAQIIVPALTHDAAPLQKQILKRLVDWNADSETRAGLAMYASGIAAVNRAALAALMGSNPVAVKSRKTAVPLAAAVTNPLDASRAVVPIDTLDELIEKVAYVLENDADTVEFERSLAGLMWFAPFDDSKRARFAAVAKRVPKVRKPVAQQLARLLHFLMTGERMKTPHSQNFSGHPNFVQLQLGQRVDDLMDLASRAGGHLPLATPTHRRGFIDPVQLVSRLAERQRQRVPASRLDFLTALMRIAPQGAGAALAPARKLGDDEHVQALRYALGADAKVGDRELMSAAQRMRALVAANAVKPRTWLVESKKFKNGKTFTSVKIDRSIPASARDPVAVLERKAAGVDLEMWFEVVAVGCAEEGSINYYSTLLPADLENFAAEGAELISRNIDWWQAQWQNKNYLRPFLDATTVMGPMATLMLAVALAGKEPGQTAVAVDVLVQSSVEQRLDAKLLAGQVAELVRTGHASCARYAKSLAAALRIDEAVAPALVEVLFAAVVSRPLDPPKDTAALLELLLEILVANDRRLPVDAAEALDKLKMGGRGNAIRKELLALA
jgi:hypothetical protein